MCRLCEGLTDGSMEHDESLSDSIIDVPIKVVSKQRGAKSKINKKSVKKKLVFQ